MDWSFASRAGAAPAVMSFRSAAREEQQGELAFPKQQVSRVLTPQRSFGAENHGSAQYAAACAAYGVQSPQQQHAPNGARVIPMSSPFNPNNPMFRVQSSPNLPNGVAAGSPFKQPPFRMNNAVAASTVGVSKSRDMPKPKTAQLTTSILVLSMYSTSQQKREYLKKIPKSGEWGDHITPQAAADLNHILIFLQANHFEAKNQMSFASK